MDLTTAVMAFHLLGINAARNRPTMCQMCKKSPAKIIRRCTIPLGLDEYVILEIMACGVVCSWHAYDCVQRLLPTNHAPSTYRILEPRSEDSSSPIFSNHTQ